jgi:hypothetical protein
MQLAHERTTGTCWADKCPARYKVTDGHGGAVFIARKLEDMDPDALAKIRDKIGDGEAAFWVPDDLL